MAARVLTPVQERLLKVLADAGLSTRGFYLTGGTALSEFYLQHRYSEDLDFFTRDQGPLQPHFDYFNVALKNQGLELETAVKGQDFLRGFVRELGRPTEALKVEFARDVLARMAPPSVWGKLNVDSLEDIAVNKISAIYGRDPLESKDFVDLYFILKESRFSLEYLMTRAREKQADFDTDEGVLYFATRLRQARTLTHLPRMIKRLELRELREPLTKAAEEIIQRLRPRGA